MPSFQSLMAELSEQHIAREVGAPHDNARMRYAPKRNSVGSYAEFGDEIGGYCAYHYGACVSKGATLERYQAVGLAREIIEQQYRRRGGNIMTAYRNARYGLDGGLRAVLDAICEGLKAQAIEKYVTDVFDRHIPPDSYEDRLAVITQFLQHCGAFLGPTVDVNHPEHYAGAGQYRELIDAYLESLQRTAAAIRRI